MTEKLLIAALYFISLGPTEGFIPYDSGRHFTSDTRLDFVSLYGHLKSVHIERNGSKNPKVTETIIYRNPRENQGFHFDGYVTSCSVYLVRVGVSVSHFHHGNITQVRPNVQGIRYWQD